MASQARRLSVKHLRNSCMTESEWQTRQQRIDTRLRALRPPWQIIRESEGFGRSATPADPRPH